jgi:hypothetical protein
MTAVHVARTGEKRNTYGILVGKPEGKRPLGRLIHMWEYNIKMDFTETEWDYMDGLIWLRIGASGGLLLTR